MPRTSAVISCMTESEFPYIGATLDSVVSQVDETILCIRDTFADFEAQQGLDRFAGRGLKVVRMPMQRLGSVRNQGMLHVTGDVVAFCDGDDVWAENKISRQLAFLLEKGADFCGCDHRLIDEQGVPRLYGMARHIPMPSSWMVRAEVQRTFPFDPDLPCVEDGDWWLRTHGKIKKVRLPEPLLLYRVREASLSSSTGSKRRKLLFMKVACLPLIGNALEFVTKIARLTLRSENYTWNNGWSHPEHKRETNGTD